MFLCGHLRHVLLYNCLYLFGLGNGFVRVSGYMYFKIIHKNLQMGLRAIIVIGYSRISFDSTNFLVQFHFHHKLNKSNECMLL